MSQLKTVPAFNSEATKFSDYVTNVSWWVQAAQVEPGKMGVVLAMHLSGTAFRAAQAMDQKCLVDPDPADKATLQEAGLPTSLSSGVPKGVCSLIIALNKAGFRQSPAEVSFAALREFQECRRKSGERMADFLFRFDLARTTAAKHGIETGDDATTAQLLLLKADLTAEDRRKVLGMLGSTTLTLDGVRQSIRTLFATEDDDFSSPGNSEVAMTATRHPLSNNGTFDWRSCVDEVEVELRLPGEQVFATRSVFIPKSFTKTDHRSKGKKKWEPGCWTCGALDHFKSQCPKSRVQRSTPQKPKTVNQSEINGEFHYDDFVLYPVWSTFSTSTPAEVALPVGYLDSACTASVCGSEWLAMYRRHLPTGCVVNEHQQRRSFSFGRDTRVSTTRVSLPIWPAGEEVRIEVSILQDGDGYRLPLLLSRVVHRDLGLLVDHSNSTVLQRLSYVQTGDTVTVRGRVLNVFEHSGLMALPLLCASDAADNRHSFLVHKVCDSGLVSKLLHLHKFYAHPTADRLSDLLSRAGYEVNADVRKELERITSSCTVCNMSRRPDQRPRACIPRAWDFQDCLAMDVFFVAGTAVLLVIDIATRFCLAGALPRGHSASQLIDVLESVWITRFGYPKCIAADNGAETKSAEFLAFCDTHNIKLELAPAQAQFANGICERHIGILKSTLSRLVQEPSGISSSPHRSEFSKTLDKSILIHNSIASIEGSSPLERLCGASPRIPCPLTDELPALSSPTCPRLLQLNLARSAFSQSQASRSLKSALAARLQRYHSTTYTLDDQVFFHSNDGIWRRGRVVGYSPAARLVSILHGKNVISRHSSKVRLSSEMDDHSTRPTAVDTDSHFRKPTSRPNWSKHRPGSEEEKEEVGRATSADDSDDDSASGTVPHVTSLNDAPNNPATPDVEEQPRSADHHSTDIDTVPDDAPSLPNPEPSPAIGALEIVPAEDAPRRSPRLADPSCTSKFAKVLCSDGQDADVTDRSQSTAPDGPDLELVLKAVKTREISPEQQGREFDAAKADEIADWYAYGVVIECSRQSLPRNHQTIGVRFVCTFKDKGEARPSPSARLVALGYQEAVGHDPVDAPTASRLSFKAIALLAAQRRWPLQSIDFKRAFLQARERSPSDPIIAIEPPPEAHLPTSTVWILRKSVYGLRSAPREWWITLYSTLREIGFKQSKHDLAVFVYCSSSGETVGAIAVHVDDVLATGSQDFENILRLVEKKFQTRDRTVDTFTHLGIQVHRSHDGSVELSQSNYIGKLAPVTIPNNFDQLPTETMEATRTLIGSLLWVAGATRLDVAAEVNILASEMKNPSISTAMSANKVLRHLMATRHATLTLPAVSAEAIAVFSDAALNNREDGRSQGGHVVCARYPDSRTLVPISWKSAIIRRVVVSSFSAELINVCSAIDDGIWSAALLSEIWGRMVLVDVYSDCRSVVANASSLRLQVREKALAKYMYLLRDVLASGQINSLNYIPTNHMIADGLTRKSPQRRNQLLRLLTGKLRDIYN